MTFGRSALIGRLVGLAEGRGEAHEPAGAGAGGGIIARMRGRRDSDRSVDRWSRSDWWGVVLDAADPRRLAHFYADLLGWDLVEESDQHCVVHPRDGGVAYLATQFAVDYERPAWPNAGGRQQMMLHLDFEVDDLDAAVAHAVELGAEEAGFPPQTGVRVLLDPAGHPFCLYLGG
jgi:catechol 2,3-dioxygenase-like lactoylglutathione lyase family enzyme